MGIPERVNRMEEKRNKELGCSNRVENVEVEQRVLLIKRNESLEKTTKIMR